MLRSRIHAVVWWLPIFPALVVISCSLFDTRDPEPPSQSAEDFAPPVLANIVIDNLRNAIIKKNPDNYMRCFSETEFRFIPSAPGSARFPNVFVGWTREQEDSHFRNLTSHVASPFFSTLYTSNDYYEPQGDSTAYSATYTLQFDHDDPTFPSVLEGRIRCVLKRASNGFWSIAEWRDDERVDSVYTWTDLKGRFRN